MWKNRVSKMEKESGWGGRKNGTRWERRVGEVERESWRDGKGKWVG